MINGKKVLAIIPARGGSKGVPRKNIRFVAGKPLIAWTIEEAKKSKYIDRVILSSEDAEIISIARQWGCEVPFVRPLNLAADETPGILPVLDILEKIPDFDIVVLLQPTSPLRVVKDIDGCIHNCIEHGAPSCVTLCETAKSPFWMFTVTDPGHMTPLMQSTEEFKLQRQELQKTYVLNGAVYVAEIIWLRKYKSFFSNQTLGYIMPQERSIDIDTKDDMDYFVYLKENSVDK